MKDIILYGCGGTFQKVLPFLMRNDHVIAVIDRHQTFWGRKNMGIPIISLEDYCSIPEYRCCEIVLTVNEANEESVQKELEKKGITNFVNYSQYLYHCLPERIVSYTSPAQYEDVILYNVFHDFDDIFYIDVGSNSPDIGSVTKLFYDQKGAHGINIDPLEDMMAITKCERRRDINICAGVGNEEKIVDFYVQGGMSTVLPQNIDNKCFRKMCTIPIITLEKICDDHLTIDQKICFLKIDVEGAEREVLEGANFHKYRPMVIVMEATLPNTMIPCHDDWEDILIENKYHYVFSYGVNRYYVADECAFLDDRFISVPELEIKYNILNIFNISV